MVMEITEPLRRRDIAAQILVNSATCKVSDSGVTAFAVTFLSNQAPVSSLLLFLKYRQSWVYEQPRGKQ
jgi:hypothetical protein